MIGKIKEFCLRHRRRLFAGAIFLASFVLYALTASHTIFTNDNPEFTAAAALAGIPHPSGYPLYVIIAWLFAKLPLGSLPYRVNLLSALCASASLVAVYFILQKAIRALDPEHRFPNAVAAALTLPLAATGLFWYQAIVAKTYTLNLLLTLVAVLLAVKCREEKRPRDFYLFALIAGLGVSNHPMFALTLPFLAAMLIVKKAWSKKIFLICAGLFILGLAPYAYIPLRSAAHPLLDWARIVDWRSFWNFIMRTQYGDLGLSSAWDKIQFLSFFSIGAFEQFSWAIILMPIGLVWTFKCAKPWCYVLAALLVSNAVGIIGLRNSAFNYANVAYFEPYYLPSYVAIFIFSAIGLWFVLRYFKKYAALAAVIIALSATGSFLIKNFPANDLHAFTFIDDLTRETLQSLPPNAVFIVFHSDLAGDTDTFAFMYQSMVARVRPDVAIIGFPSTFRQVDDKAVFDALGAKDMYARRMALYLYAQKTYPNRPIYATFPYFICDKEGKNCVLPSVNRLTYGPPNASSASAEKFFISDRDRYVLEQDIFGEQFLADYYFIQASFELKNNNDAGAADALKTAVKESPISSNQPYLDFRRFQTIANENSNPSGAFLPKTKK